MPVQIESVTYFDWLFAIAPDRLALLSVFNLVMEDVKKQVVALCLYDMIQGFVFGSFGIYSFEVRLQGRCNKSPSGQRKEIMRNYL